MSQPKLVWSNGLINGFICSTCKQYNDILDICCPICKSYSEIEPFFRFRVEERRALQSVKDWCQMHRDEELYKKFYNAGVGIAVGTARSEELVEKIEELELIAFEARVKAGALTEEIGRA